MGNLLAFVPFGFLLPAAFPKVLRPYWKAGAVFLACIAALECAQMLTHLGSFDIEDILVNFLGFSIGFASWKISLRVPEMWRKACVYIGCVCLFSLVLLIAAEGFNQILR